MSGLGRRTHYRKHLTDSVLYDYPEPASNECIAKIIATRGSNQFDIQLAKSYPDPKKNSDEKSCNIQQPDYSSKNDSTELAILPTKFRKLIWLKRNDFVIVQYATDDIANSDSKNEKLQVNESSTLPSKDETDTLDRTVSDDISKITAAAPSQSDNNGICTSSVGGGGIRYMITHILYKNQIQHLRTTGLWPTHDPIFQDTTTTIIGDDAAPTTTIDSDGIVFTTNKNDTALVGHDEHIYGDSGVEDTNSNGSYDHYDEDEDKYYSTEDDNDDDLFINTNRMARIELQDSDEE